MHRLFAPEPLESATHFRFAGRLIQPEARPPSASCVAAFPAAFGREPAAETGQFAEPRLDLCLCPIPLAFQTLKAKQPAATDSAMLQFAAARAAA
jgi:hypothetical protein